MLGVGRGDSALTQIGHRPVPVAELERALATIQSLLRGEKARFGAATSEIQWIAEGGESKVPLTVAATGPRVIKAAARHAEWVDFTVGAEPDRIRWAAATAHAAADGRLSLGAYVNVAVHPDRAAARDLVRGSTAILARFATEGAPPDGLSDVTKRGIARLGAAYDESRHGESAAPGARELEDEFIDRFAVCGPAPEVAERLVGLAELGLERVIAVPGSLDADPGAVAESNARFAAEVLPALR